MQLYQQKLSSKGFTLIEIAIVLVIVGLLLGLGTSLVGPLTKKSKRSESQEDVNAAVNAIIGYAASNNRLPVWGDNTADGTLDEFCEVVTDRTDSFQKPIYYFCENLLTAVGSVCSRQTTTLTICRDGSCTDRIPNVAFIVVSGAENYNPQTGIVTTGCPAGQTCIGVFAPETADIDDCTGGGNCPNYQASLSRINRAEPYDDIVEWVRLDELQSKIICASAQSKLRITNDSLPSGVIDMPYSATVFAEGGVPFSSGGDYKWCREINGTTPSGLLFTLGTSGTYDVISADCLNLAEGSWGQTDSITIEGIPADGAFSFTFYVRDNNDSSGVYDNIVEKTLSISVSAHDGLCSQSGGCSDACSVHVENDSSDTIHLVVPGDGGGPPRVFDKIDAGNELTITNLKGGDEIAVYNQTCAGGNQPEGIITLANVIGEYATLTYRGPDKSPVCR